MKLRKKLKPQLRDEILELRQSRSDILNFSTNFLTNTGKRHDFIQIVLNQYKQKSIKKEIVEISAGLYLSSLVTCWETFFRDIFVFVTETDNDIDLMIKNSLTEKGIRIEEVNKEGLSVGEYMSKQFNFQDLNSTCNAFNFLFNESKSSITEYVPDVLNRPIAFSSPNYVLYWIQQKQNISQKIEQVLSNAFANRHKVTHDANFYFIIDPEFMTMIDDCFILFPQFISLWLADKYNQRRFVICKETQYIRLTECPKENEIPFVFSTKDFDGKYNIVD